MDDVWGYLKVRQTFVDYFIGKGHSYIPSSSVVPSSDDESLLYVNSGMVAFKNIFLNKEPSPFPTVTNYQRCIRAGGKHNDLDDVGTDSYHHTYFEMLGNWSFNYDHDSKQPYFREAIDMAWDLLINVYHLDPTRLYATYFGGQDGLPADLETREYWKKYLPEHRIIPFGMKENFWEMGLSGPCGPCTEIHYDKLGHREVPELVNKDDPSLIEIWNIVLMQYFRDASGTLTPLTKKHVDTGAGCERLTAILQNCDNYTIDLFTSIISIIQNVTGGPQYQNRYGSDDKEFMDTAYRVIADHVRTLIFAVNDGVIPSATDRGYVIRRLIRRAIRYANKLTKHHGFLVEIVSKVINLFETDYGEIINNKDLIITTVTKESNKFSTVMTNGLKYFNKLMKQGTPSMDQLFQLYATFGFPIDIIKQLCQEHGIHFDIQEYEGYMKEHIVLSKKGKKFE
jgi:alanyl-tRNA synthetase